MNRAIVGVIAGGALLAAAAVFVFAATERESGARVHRRRQARHRRLRSRRSLRRTVGPAFKRCCAAGSSWRWRRKTGEPKPSSSTRARGACIKTTTMTTTRMYRLRSHRKASGPDEHDVDQGPRMLGRCSSPDQASAARVELHSAQSLGPAIPVGPSFLAMTQSEARRSARLRLGHRDDALGSGEAKREHHSSAGILFRRNAPVMRPHDLGHDCKTKSGAG